MKKVRKWLRILHRDIGYLAVGVTIIFAVSGIAVNHIHDWNSNYSIELERSEITVKGLEKEALVNDVLTQLNIKKEAQGWHQVAPDEMQIFLEGNTIHLNMNSGKVVQEKVNPRPFLRDFNKLHLNEPGGAWTIFSDFYAVCLIFLAISGIFLIKGKKGWKWRGTILVTIGTIIPILFLMYYS